MKTVFICLALFGACMGQYSNSNGYGAPQGYGAPPSQGYGVPPSQGYGPPQNQGYLPQREEDEAIPTVRHVFVHVAPDDKSSGVARVIKAPIKRERQVNILFVKAPAPAAPDRQIVDIPNDGGRKTLVYVLLKKQDSTPDVDFKLPKPTQASKPEIYFIRYKDGKRGPAPGGTEYGAPTSGAQYRLPLGHTQGTSKSPSSKYSVPPSY